MSTSVTMQGKPLTLEGQVIKEGDKAPDFEVVNGDLKPVKFSSLKGKLTLILSVPSLDTSVCSRETKRVNQEIGKYSDQVQCVTISMDLPFAQKRWCGAEGVKNVSVFSDYKSADFGKKYGVLIPDLRLLARAVWIVDQNGVVKYFHLVPEVTNEPPYDEILSKLQTLLSGVK